MNHRRSLRLALFSLCMGATQAEANGINPPRHEGSKIVVARCTLQKTGAVVELQRARFAEDAVSGVELRMGTAKAPVQSIDPAKVSRIDFAGKSRSDGFMKATLDLRDPSYQGAGFVKVKSGRKALVLTGFAPSLDRVEVELASCKALTFDVSDGAEPAHQSTTKK